MASTASTRLRVEQIGEFEKTNAWAASLNAAIQRLDDGIAQFTTIALTGNYTLTSANFIEDEARAAMLRFTGTGAFVVTVPAVSKLYCIINDCTGNVTITPLSGTGSVVRPGTRMVVAIDGSVARTFDTTLDKVASPVAAVSLNNQKITNLATPTLTGDAATKGYVDAATADRSMGGFKITNVAAGTAGSTNAANVAQVEAAIASATVNMPSQVGNANRFLTTNGTAPSWSLVPLTTGVSGTLPVANGGTGIATLATGSVPIGAGTGAFTAAAPGASGTVLTSNGVGVAPTFQAPQAPGYVRLSETVVGTAVATVDITTNINSTYDIYVLELINVRPSTDAVELLCRFSSNGGSSFVSSTYVGNTRSQVSGGAINVNASGSTALSVTGISYTVGNATNENGVCGFIYFYRPATSQWLQTNWTANFTESGGNFASNEGEAVLQTAASYNALRLLFSSGNIASGTIRLGAFRNAP